jgi:flagellar biosynthesis/type III secretory pathway chaperone
MKTSQCRERLSELMQAQNDRITSANEYLLVIRKAIADNQLDKLQQSLASPDLAIEDIETLEQRRHQVLASFGFDQDNDGLEKCIAWCDDEQKQLSGLYRQLIKNLVDLQHSIQVNSLLVNKGQQRVKRSIGILTGVGTSTTCKTYGSKGETIDHAGRRGIAVA